MLYLYTIWIFFFYLIIMEENQQKIIEKLRKFYNLYFDIFVDWKKKLTKLNILIENTFTEYKVHPF